MAIEVLNEFDKAFRDELLAELVELNREAFAIVKEELKNDSKWVGIKVLVEKRVVVARNLSACVTRECSDVIEQEKVSIVNIFMIWQMSKEF